MQCALWSNEYIHLTTEHMETYLSSNGMLKKVTTTTTYQFYISCYHTKQ